VRLLPYLRFPVNCIRLRSVSRALWVLAYDKEFARERA